MVSRGSNHKTVPLQICGSSSFGRYFKISEEKTLNMLLSDGWLVDLGGYQIVNFEQVLGNIGRGIHTSTKLNRMIVVIGANVWALNVFFDNNILMTFDTSAVLIGTLATNTGVVYITENNKPQVVISDGVHIYFYDPALAIPFQIATKDGTAPIDFTPGYIDFHDTYILVAASNDNFYSPPANNTWRLGVLNTADPPGLERLIFPDNPNGISFIGLIQTKPDNTQAVVRVPSKGNMILVMGRIVTEAWFDTGAQLFPYQRTNQYSIDYGCLNPATVATTDQMVVWLAQNEKSGPIVMYTNGETIEKITTDGIDFKLSQLQHPEDSQGFLYRQDGHLIYHINFYTDNLSLFYDFNTQKFFHASDENGNYFIPAQMAFFNNQYYFVTKNNGNVYAFDTIFTTYNGAEIPRERICKSVRDPSQRYFIANDTGFTIEQGQNNPNTNQIANFTILNGGSGYIGTPTLNFIGGNGFDAAATLTVAGGVITGVTLTNPGHNYTYPPILEVIGTGIGAQIVCTITPTAARIDLSICRDGGQIFGNDIPYILNPNGVGQNMLRWWQLGLANDFIPRFRFYSVGRFVAYDGEVNIRL